MDPITYEVCVENMQGIQAAHAAGARRVELCSNLSLGGTTPSAGLIQSSCMSGMDVVVLLRPRAGDFVYQEHEYDVILRDLICSKECGAKGVALGLLTAEGEVDMERCAKLVQFAGDMPVCFHRAFDFTRDLFKTLEQLIEIGVKRVLTSGGANDVVAGTEQLAKLVERAAGRIEIMPGGGVRPDNVGQVLRKSGARSIHFSASEFQAGDSQHQNPNCSLQASGRPTEFEYRLTSEAQVRAIIHAAQA